MLEYRNMEKGFFQGGARIAGAMFGVSKTPKIKKKGMFLLANKKI